MPGPYRLHLHFPKKDGSHQVDENFMLYVHVLPGVRRKGSETKPKLDVQVKATLHIPDDDSLDVDLQAFDPPRFTDARKVVNVHAFPVQMPKGCARKMCRLKVTAKYVGNGKKHPTPGEADALIVWNGNGSPMAVAAAAIGIGGPTPEIDYPDGSGTFGNPAQVTLGPGGTLTTYGMIDPCSTPVSATLVPYNPNPPPPPGPPPGPVTVIVMAPCPPPQTYCWAFSVSGLAAGQAYQLTVQTLGGGSVTIYITT